MRDQAHARLPDATLDVLNLPAVRLVRDEERFLRAGVVFENECRGLGEAGALPAPVADGFDINTLTVIATESYEEFAENLQKEIEKDTGIKFGIVEKHQFASMPIINADGSTGMLGFEESASIFDHLKSQGFVDAKGKVQDTLRMALKDGSFALPPALTPRRRHGPCRRD